VPAFLQRPSGRQVDDQSFEGSWVDLDYESILPANPECIAGGMCQKTGVEVPSPRRKMGIMAHNIRVFKQEDSIHTIIVYYLI
jgi:hypothetical protein